MKTAVITGTSYGLGKSIADAFLRDGYKVYGLSRSKPAMDDKQFVWLHCDVSQPAEIRDCIGQITEPTIDVLVSNAGIVFDERASAVNLETYQKTFSVNVLGPMLLVSALRNKITHATILSVSSVSDRLPSAEVALYCSSKAANTSYFNSLALDLPGAKVYTLLPDFIDTPMLRESFANDKNFKWDVIIQPQDIATFSLDLISGRYDLASGTNIIIVTNALTDSLKNVEKLLGFNTDTSVLTKL